MVRDLHVRWSAYLILIALAFMLEREDSGALVDANDTDSRSAFRFGGIRTESSSRL